MSLNRYAKKRDLSEPEIVATLRSLGFSVYQLDVPLDLLVGFRGKNYLVECKTEKKKLTKAQVLFVEEWRGQHVILRNAEQALEWAKEVRKNDI